MTRVDKPTTYKRFRRLYWGTLYEIGVICVDPEKQRRYARELWELRSRAARLLKRMEAERDAFTSSYASAILDSVFGKDRVQP